MNKATRLQVYGKYNGHCAYCGKAIELKDMQVDHIGPQCAYNVIDKADADHIHNLNPSCYRRNHYKRGGGIEYLRKLLQTLHERIRKDYICKVAEDYGIIKVEPWDGTFYYEKESEAK